MDNHSSRRMALTQYLIQQGYLRTPEIIEAFKAVPRHLFVPEPQRKDAYTDVPLPIGHGQTISAPHMNALCTELLNPEKNDAVFEVGTGSGYQAALLAGLVKNVVSIELERGLVMRAQRALKETGVRNVVIRHGDGSKGYRRYAPYDKIIVTCACEHIPPQLIDQLKPEGTLVLPLGHMIQTLTAVKKTARGIITERHGGCVFVPLRR
jgi:protein-L-isoaspartate(D-aspartate) O-methyltransferase